MLDQVVLRAVSDVLDQRLFEAAVEKALETLRLGQDERLTRQKAIERELSLIEACEKHLVDAITRGESLEPLLARLKSEESRKKELIAELGSLTKPASTADLDKARLKRNLLDRLANARSLLGRHATQARQILQKLLEKPLICEVIKEGGKKGYRVTGQGSYLHLIPENVASPFVVSHLRDNWNQLFDSLKDMELLRNTTEIQASGALLTR